MLPLLLVFSLLVVQLASAAPTNAASESPAPAPDPTSSNYRSVWSILGTCALTLIICIWKTSFPNITHEESRYKVVLYRVALGLVALVTPEITTMRAYSEWRHAGRIKGDFSDQQWTRTHGFFALMGGFILQDGRKQGLLSTRKALKCLRHEKLVNPKITEKEISDRSKSDALGNVLLVLQLSWFILQVIARAANDLAITLVEIDTLTLAALSLPLFFFWWSKPMAVEYDVAHRIPDFDHHSIMHLIVLHATIYREEAPCGEDNPDSSTGQGNDDDSLLVQSDCHIPFVYPDCSWCGRSFHPFGIDACQRNASDKQWTRTHGFFALMGGFILQDGAQQELLNTREVIGGGDDDENVVFVGLIVWMVFGALHTIAWDFQFPSQTEKTIWHVASFTLIGAPCIFFLAFFIDKIKVVRPSDILMNTIAGVTLCIGVVARFLLLVLMLASLRDLPPSAHDTVSWTVYVPHL
ncbi:hypothetical protein PAXINDRAFT_88943 [Paxillus involutus ATCC 200175]|uniref:Uncharacterized protein n=1 Tax=Paxillus involutus ATCC 200175 TaxID=664439 RepID=A0A0C9TBC5_PAXIN|nr:hypothetical protein PAXINDRAFT_88943 [Paxillus involutus ATCC 200175]